MVAPAERVAAPTDISTELVRSSREGPSRRALSDAKLVLPIGVLGQAFRPTIVAGKTARNQRFRITLRNVAEP